MKKITTFICLIILITFCGGSYGSTNLQIVSPGQTLESMEVSGHQSKPAIIKFKANSKINKTPNEGNILEIKDDTLLYLPSSIEIIAIESKVYAKENLSKEIEKHYSINFPLFGLIMFTVFTIAGW